MGVRGTDTAFIAGHQAVDKAFRGARLPATVIRYERADQYARAYGRRRRRGLGRGHDRDPPRVLRLVRGGRLRPRPGVWPGWRGGGGFLPVGARGMRGGPPRAAGGGGFPPFSSAGPPMGVFVTPPVIWEADRGWFTTAPFSEPEVFEFPEGIGPVECVNVEHEEVLLMPRWVDARRVTFKYGLGDEFIGILKTLNQLGLDKTTPLRVRSADGPV